MNLVIEKPNVEDAAEVIEYLKQVGSESDNLSFGPEGMGLSLDAEEEYIRSQIDNPHSVMFVARLDGRIVGDISFTASARERLQHRGEIGIAVMQEAWGMGIGTKLMEAALDFAKNTAHAEIVHLEVRSDNLRAIHLYEKFGFRKIGTFPGFLKIDGKWVDFDLMNLYL